MAQIKESLITKSFFMLHKTHKIDLTFVKKFQKCSHSVLLLPLHEFMQNGIFSFLMSFSYTYIQSDRKSGGKKCHDLGNL